MAGIMAPDLSQPLILARLRARCRKIAQAILQRISSALTFNRFEHGRKSLDPAVVKSALL